MIRAGEVRKDPGSFRDPDGFVFYREGAVFRQINDSYREDFRALMSSGLYAALAGKGMLVPHEETGSDPGLGGDCHLVIKPERIPFIAYPYEWCFGQLRDAALLTLDIQAEALERGMILKDASAYNIQFRGSRPVHIDTLSFARYADGMVWDGYGQFCRHFLAPLALMSRRDPRLGALLRIHLDGIPLDLASALLPASTWASPGLLFHLHLHARSQRRYAGKARPAADARLGKRGLAGIIGSLRACVASLAWDPAGTEWGGYRPDELYGSAAEAKRELVRGALDRIRPRTCWDFGANDGNYSRLASDAGIATLAFDLDPGAVEANYRACRARGETRMLPLLMDLANPSPALGWNHGERASLLDRGPAELGMALALSHHLAIAHNVPWEEMAGFFAGACRDLLIEFVPKSDPQAALLLASRRDVFDGYHEEGFRAAFSRRFALEDRMPIPGSPRVLYLMRRDRP